MIAVVHPHDVRRDLADAYARYVEHHVDRWVRRDGRHRFNTLVADKVCALRRTCVRCPPWAEAWMPAWAHLAVRVDLRTQRAPLSFDAFCDLRRRSGRLVCRHTRFGQRPTGWVH